MGNTLIRIAQKAAETAVNDEMQAQLITLTKMVAELEKQTPDKSALQKLLGSLSNTWLPGLITSLISNIITMAAL